MLHHNKSLIYLCYLHCLRTFSFIIPKGSIRSSLTRNIWSVTYWYQWQFIKLWTILYKAWFQSLAPHHMGHLWVFVSSSPCFKTTLQTLQALQSIRQCQLELFSERRAGCYQHCYLKSEGHEASWVTTVLITAGNVHETTSGGSLTDIEPEIEWWLTSRETARAYCSTRACLWLQEERLLSSEKNAALSVLTMSVKDDGKFSSYTSFRVKWFSKDKHMELFSVLLFLLVLLIFLVLFYMLVLLVLLLLCVPKGLTQICPEELL